jgi:spore maturation protein CgeB
MSNVGQIEMYKKAGAKNVYYWQIGYDHKCYKPLNNKTFKYDIVFAGSAYGNIFPDAKLRMNIVSYLKERFGDRFGLFGTGYPNNFKASYVDIRDINAVYNSSLTNLSVSNFNDIDHYFSDRLILAMASGRPCISYRFPGQESYFKHKQDILIANNINEIGDYVDFCKKNSEEANEIGNNGYRIVKYEHSFRSRVAELLDITGVSNLL